MKKLLTLAVLVAGHMLINASNVKAQWSLTGNGLTNPPTNFIGTTDVKDLVFKTNNTERLRISSSGNIGIGTTVPSSTFVVNSSGSVGLTGGAILQLGTITSNNLVFDKDEIQSRNNGVAATLSLNRLGGNVGVGISPAYKFDVLNSSETRSANFKSDYSGTGTKYGIYNEVTELGSGIKYGFYNSVAASDNSATMVRGIYNKVNCPGSGWSYGIISSVTPGSGDSYGVYSEMLGTGSGTKYAIYGTSPNGGWAGYFPQRVYANTISVGSPITAISTGGAGSGDLDPKLIVDGDAYIADHLSLGVASYAAGYKLSVDGKIICEELRVQNSTDWPDYVFDKDYGLLSLDELSKEISITKHLPGIPSASEVMTNGLNIGDMQKKMMEKIEELTLYVIDLKKENDALAQRLSQVECK